MDFRDGHVNVRDGDMSAHDQLGLKWDSKQLLGGGGPTEPTLKVWRTLLRTDFQPVIVSLSLFTWRSREAPLRLPSLTIFRWISATVLHPKTS